MDKDIIFSSEQYERAYQKIKNRVTDEISSVQNPTAIVLGGQPGAGKSSLYKEADIRFRKNIAHIDIDKFREYHPDAAELNKVPETYGQNTNEFAGAVVDRLIDELGEKRFNMIIESSMKSPNAAFQNYDLLNPRGYKLEAQVMATPKEISWQSVQDRYEKEKQEGKLARTVPKDFHDYVVENIVNSLDMIYQSNKMNDIIIYNRDMEVVYQMTETPQINPSILLDSIINQSALGGKAMTDIENKELIEKARTADLADYFRTSGYTLKKICGETYVNEIKGLVINTESNSWFSHYQQVGRRNNSIDCLTMILDKSFKEAVYELTGQDISHTRSSDRRTEQKPIMKAATQKPQEKRNRNA